MTDTLNITELKVLTQIGVYAWEQKITQALLFDLSIPIAVQNCQDKIENTLDYAKICQGITDFVSQRSFQLLETVADEVLHYLQTTFNIQRITLMVTKPGAVKNAGKIQVKVVRA